MKEIGGRLKTARTKFVKKSRAKVEKELNLPKYSVKNYEDKYSTSLYVWKFCKKYPINLAWIMEGDPHPPVK